MASVNVVYDLRVLPPTFDFPDFLALADARRQLETSAESLSVWIVVGPSRRPKNWDWNDAVSDDEVRERTLSRLNRVIIPCAHLVGSVVSVNVIDSSHLSDLGFPVFHPVNYSFKNPAVGVYHKRWYLLDYAKKIDMRSLRNQRSELESARRYLRISTGSESPAIITYRNNIYSFDQTRNTRLDLLVDLIDSLRRMGFAVGVVPDTSLTGVDASEIRDHLITAPSFDVTLRSAVYECASLCLFEPTGPFVLAQLNPNVRFIVYGMAWSNYFSASYQTERGFEPDVNFIAPGCNFQQYLWSSLDRDFLERWVEEVGVLPK